MLIVELLNSSIEATVDRISLDHHRLSGRAKDLGSAAVMLSLGLAALDRVALGLLDDHARHCLVGGHGGPTEPEDKVQELMSAVGRMLAR